VRYELAHHLEGAFQVAVDELWGWDRSRRRWNRSRGGGGRSRRVEGVEGGREGEGGRCGWWEVECEECVGSVCSVDEGWGSGGGGDS
jgi:hypothetical protein